jgi:hypothetical protein
LFLSVLQWSSDAILSFYFSEFEEPLNLQNGWLLWAGIGFLVALVVIALAGAATTFLNGETPQREVCFHNYLLSILLSS